MSMHDYTDTNMPEIKRWEQGYQEAHSSVLMSVAGADGGRADRHSGFACLRP